MDTIEKRIADIETRNKKVELEKAWETSTTRKLSILCLTYIVTSIAMIALDIDRPFINAIIPTLGFFLSAQSLPAIKKIWLGRQGK